MIPLTSLRELARLQADRPALIDADGVTTRAEFADATETAAKHLSETLGTLAAARVAVLAVNSRRLCVAYAACATMKITVVGLDYRADIDRLVHCVRLVEADAILYSAEFEEKAAELAARLPLVRVPLSGLAQTARSGALVEPPPRPFESLAFTSGTSGLPKAVCRTKSFEVRRFAELRRRFGFDESDVYLVTLPLAHVSSSGWTRLFTSLGATIVLGDVSRPEDSLDAIEQCGVTAFVAVPPTLDRMVRAAEYRPAFQHRVRFVLTGGKHVPLDLKSRFISVFGSTLHEYYGTTETGVNTIATPDQLVATPRTSGSPMDGSRVVILDAVRDVPLRSGRIGRVAIASYQLMDAYLGVPAPFVELEGERLFVTPDVGWLDSENHLFLTSRGDLVQSGASVDVYRIESGLRALPGVRDACLLPGERTPRPALVVLDPQVDRETIVAAARTSGSQHGVSLLDIVVVPQIPYSLSGKVDIRTALALATPTEITQP